MSFPPGTEMFQFPGFASYAYVFSIRSPCGGVAPFGYPWIKACSRLPMAFRSVPRPSSPPGAKASTECPFVARYLSASKEAPFKLTTTQTRTNKFCLPTMHRNHLSEPHTHHSDFAPHHPLGTDSNKPNPQ